MDIVFILVSFSLSCLSIKNGVYMYPVLLSSSIMWISSSVYFLVANDFLTPPDYFGLPIAYSIDTRSYNSTFYAYYPFLIVNIFVYLLLSFSSRGKNHNSRLSFTSGINDIKSRLRYLKRRHCAALLVFVSLFTVLHVFDVDWRVLWENRQYLRLVYPDGAGLTSPITMIFHNSIGLFVALCAFMAIYLTKQKSYVLSAFFFIVFMYLLTIKVAQFSRWAPLAVVIFCMSYVLIYGYGRVRDKVFIVICLYIAWVLFVIAIEGRSYHTQGIKGALNLISGGEESYRESQPILFFLLNVFGGFFVTQEAIGSYVTYPVSYQVLSFSFLPGVLDGWRDIVKYTAFVNPFTPYNVISEIYFFYPLVSFVFYAYYVFVSIYLSKLVERGKFVGTYVMIPCFTMMAFFMQFYPIRNSIKLLTAAFIVVVVFDFFLKGRSRQVI